MAGALRFCVTALIATLAATPIAAADLATPVEPPLPVPPSFYVQAGAMGSFFETNAQRTGGGVFGISNVAIRPVYTFGLEAGYFVTPNIAIALSAGVPPIEHFKATGLPHAAALALGTNLLGSARIGSVILLLQYHFTQFGAIQPYAGIGAGYALNFGNISDGILRNFSIDQNFALILQAGADLMLTPNWGVFVDGKKAFYSTDTQGFAGPVPVRAHTTLDPWRASAGIAFKY